MTWIYAAYRTLIEQSELPVVLYAFRSSGARHLHPSGVPIDVYSRIADLPNVVAVKLTQTLHPVTSLQLCERVAGRLLVGPADLSIEREPASIARMAHNRQSRPPRHRANLSEMARAGGDASRLHVARGRVERLSA